MLIGIKEHLNQHKEKTLESSVEEVVTYFADYSKEKYPWWNLCIYVKVKTPGPWQGSISKQMHMHLRLESTMQLENTQYSSAHLQWESSSDKEGADSLQGKSTDQCCLSPLTPRVH